MCSGANLLVQPSTADLKAAVQACDMFRLMHPHPLHIQARNVLMAVYKSSLVWTACHRTLTSGAEGWHSLLELWRLNSSAWHCCFQSL